MQKTPRVWVLLGKGTGGNNQMIALAEALGWPYETRQLKHNKLNLLPTLLLGATAITVDRDKSDALEAPWPDLVIAASRRAAPVALWIKKQSGGRTRLVHLMHVQAPLSWFDLILTMPQYRLPQRDNIVHLTGALNRIDPELLDAAGREWAARLAAQATKAPLPRPWTALLVGGNSSSYLLGADTAAELGREASHRVRERGGSLLVTTSPRTPPEAAVALASSIDVPSFVYVWKKDDQSNNPYRGFLALADDFIVTVDSASLLVEACSSGRTVKVFEWPRRGGAPSEAPAAGLEQRLGPGLYRRLIDWGLIKPPRDFDAYHTAMMKRGLASRLGAPDPEQRRPLDDMERSVERIRALFDFPPQKVQTS